MAELKISKVVSALPATLDANSIYAVRVGLGFDLYVTNSSGTVVAYGLNIYSQTHVDVDTYAHAILVAPVVGVTLEIWVAADEKNGGGPTIYKLKPNGDRYLTAFLITKDN